MKVPALLMAVLLCAATHAQPYAVEVLDHSNDHTPCDNCDPTTTLGAPDGTNVPVGGFYSLGPLGHLDVRMGQPILDVTGADLFVWEERTGVWDGVPGSVGSVPDETADVSLSFDGDNWTFVGQIVAGDRTSLGIDIAGTGMSGASFVRIEDVSGRNAPRSPGFDVDAIVIVPEPAAIALLAAGALFMPRRTRGPGSGAC